MADLFPERIETDRLVLGKICPENVTTHELYDLFSGPKTGGVFEHVPQSPYRSLDEPREMIENAAESWRDGAVASYAVRPSDGELNAGALAGTAQLYPEWEKRSARLGLILGKQFWGRGYSGERASALMELAFDRLDLEHVLVSHNVGNTKSRRAIEKYVERFGGEHDCLLRNRVPMDDEVNDIHRYTIMREQWEANNEEHQSTMTNTTTIEEDEP